MKIRAKCGLLLVSGYAIAAGMPPSEEAKQPAAPAAILGYLGPKPSENLPGGLFAAAADFNRDGVVDMVVIDSSTAHILVSLGLAQGTFLAPKSYATADGPVALLVNDFNGDGKPDLAVVSCGSSPGCTEPGLVSILLGNGDGTFQAKHDFAVGSNPQWAAAGDFNGDGKIDLAVANYYDGSVSILLGKGDGGFKPQTSFPAAPFPVSVSAGRLSGSGNTDLVIGVYCNVTCTSAGDVVLFGNGDGSFQEPVTIGISGQAVIADLNNDGSMDVASGGGVLLGDGHGAFQTVIPLNGVPTPIVAADLNHDGKADLAFGIYANCGPRCALAGAVEVFLGNGDGSFAAPIGFETGAFPSSLVVADFNADGKPDIATNLSNGVLLQSSLAFSPTSYLFPTKALQTASKPQSIMMTNAGNKPVDIAGVSLNGTNPESFQQTNNCLGALPPGASCTLSLVFRPASIGAQSSVLTIHDSSVGSPQQLPLSGTGTAALLTPGRLYFGDQPVGTSSGTRNVSLKNQGASPLRIYAIQVGGKNAGDFDEADNCPALLGPGMSCAVQVKFSPSTISPREGVLAVRDDGGSSPQLVLLNGSGE
jgi:hypothetical protein